MYILAGQVCSTNHQVVAFLSKASSALFILPPDYPLRFTNIGVVQPSNRRRCTVGYAKGLLAKCSSLGPTCISPPAPDIFVFSARHLSLTRLARPQWWNSQPFDVLLKLASTFFSPLFLPASAFSILFRSQYVFCHCRSSDDSQHPTRFRGQPRKDTGVRLLIPMHRCSS